MSAADTPTVLTPSRRLRAGLSVAALAVPALLLAASTQAVALPGNPGNGATANANPPGSGRCAPMTTRKVAGTLIGAGGLGLDATIGIDLLDASGRKVRAATGCPSGGDYGAVLQLNHYVRSSGAPVGSRQTDARGRDQGLVDPHFALLNLPANVTQVFVETYNRDYLGSPCGLSCAGPLDVKHFALVNERSLTPGPQTANLRLTPVPASQTGSLKLMFNRSDIASVLAFDFTRSAPANGWAIAGPTAGGVHGHASIWLAPALPTASRKGYLLEVTLNDGRVVHMPDFLTGATSGYTTHKGVTSTQHITLRP